MITIKARLEYATGENVTDSSIFTAATNNWQDNQCIIVDNKISVTKSPVQTTTVAAAATTTKNSVHEYLDTVVNNCNKDELPLGCSKFVRLVETYCARKNLIAIYKTSNKQLLYQRDINDLYNREIPIHLSLYSNDWRLQQSPVRQLCTTSPEFVRWLNAIRIYVTTNSLKSANKQQNTSKLVNKPYWRTYR
ncbi:hypothetical protein DOLIC_00151 [Dolichomitus sp. PSUC_FEM 10030005]|nr:hypothetical protein [Dolichomitus sp. PSUC_FEM 10030005]